VRQLKAVVDSDEERERERVCAECNAERRLVNTPIQIQLHLLVSMQCGV